MKTTGDHLSTFNQASTTTPFRESSALPQTGITSYPVDYSFTPTADYNKIGATTAATANPANLYGLTYNETTENILDLSVPTTIQLDSSWQSDPIVSSSATPYNQSSLQKSALYPSTSFNSFLSPTLPTVQSDSTYGGLVSAAPEISLVSPNTTQNHYQKMREEVPMRFKALWDSIHPLTSGQSGSDLPGHTTAVTSTATTPKSTSKTDVTPVVPRASPPSDTTVKPAHPAPSGDVSLKEMMEIDDLDMGDISNIISVPIPKPMKSSASTSAVESNSTPHQPPPQTLPTLSSFLRGLEYL